MRYDEHGQRVTDCCGAYSTYVEDARDPAGPMVLACKVCYKLVPVGQGDGTEFAPGVTSEEYFAAVFEAERQEIREAYGPEAVTF